MGGRSRGGGRTERCSSSVIDPEKGFSHLQWLDHLGSLGLVVLLGLLGGRWAVGPKGWRFGVVGTGEDLINSKMKIKQPAAPVYFHSFLGEGLSRG